MDEFGVKKPSLRAIARTPVIPELFTHSPSGEAERIRQIPRWLGMGLHGLKGEEFSAFGVGKEEGGLQLLQIRGRSPAARAGFQADDLVQRINGASVRTPEELVVDTVDHMILRVKLVGIQTSAPVAAPENRSAGRQRRL